MVTAREIAAQANALIVKKVNIAVFIAQKR
jgi:hypothetical protein